MCGRQVLLGEVLAIAQPFVVKFLERRLHLSPESVAILHVGLRDFDRSMPEGERLGEFLDSIEVPVGELQIGDEVWMFSHYDDWKVYPVVGFGQPEFNRISVWGETDDGKTDATYPNLPYVAWMDHDGDFSWNSNNYVHGPMARIKLRV